MKIKSKTQQQQEKQANNAEQDNLYNRVNAYKSTETKQKNKNKNWGVLNLVIVHSRTMLMM